MNQPIDPVQLYYDFDREPFEPRRVHLADGSVLDITLRELVVIGVDYLDIGIQAEDEETGICSTLVTVPFSEIQEIEIVGSRPGVVTRQEYFQTKALAMRPDDFRVLRRRPFEPFTLHLTTGASFEVRDPKLAVVGRSIVWLQQGLPNHVVPVAVRRIAISLVHIVWIEFPEDAQRHHQN